MTHQRVRLMSQNKISIEEHIKRLDRRIDLLEEIIKTVNDKANKTKDELSKHILNCTAHEI